jgi:hypothetical protein
MKDLFSSCQRHPVPGGATTQIQSRQCVLPGPGIWSPQRNRAIPRPFLLKTGPFPQDHLRRRFSGNLPRCTGVLNNALDGICLIVHDLWSDLDSRDRR